jgi:hypothetical protein
VRNMSQNPLPFLALGKIALVRATTQMAAAQTPELQQRPAELKQVAAEETSQQVLPVFPAE